MKITYILLFLIVTAIILYTSHVWIQREGFATTRSEYIEIGKQRYNPLSDPVDVIGPGLMGPSLNAQGRIALNNKIHAATTTSQMKQTDSNNLTFMEPVRTPAKIAVPPESSLATKIRKCENKKTRDSCDILDNNEYKECGVCINEGTGVFSSTEGSHIGGLYMSEADKQLAMQYNGKGDVPYEAQYHTPTIGKCAPNFFFVNKTDCVRAARVQNCKEVGNSGGGFQGGKTKENKTAQQAQCAQCGDDKNAFAYQPYSENKASIRLRALVPAGTGKTVLMIQKANGSLVGQVVSEYNANLPNREIICPIFESIRENEELKITVYQQFPYRATNASRSEVFHLDKDAISEGYTSKTEAQTACGSVGATLATQQQITSANQMDPGLQSCKAGWLSDGTAPLKSAKAFLQATATNKCQATVGVTADTQATKAGAWCYGVKPQAGRYTATRASEILFDSVVEPFFKSFGADSTPSQANKPTVNSQYTQAGNDYVAPNYRAILLQWESTDSDMDPTRIVKFPVFPTITQMNGIDIRTSIESQNATMRIYGSFNSSEIILSPKPNAASLITNNGIWLWSNSNVSNSLIITAKVPGILKQAMYEEEREGCSGKGLITSMATLQGLKTSACDSSPTNQAPGTYSIPCLRELFVNAGGDLLRGDLSPTKPENVEKLRKKPTGETRTRDEIMTFLVEQFTIATTGRTSNGALVGSTGEEQKRNINISAKNMFGKELISPCEKIAVNNQGTVTITTKTGPFDEDCLAYLYKNASYETDRARESSNTGNLIKPTYESIGSRYSGLMRRDMASATEKQNHPFKTCNSDGTMNPKHTVSSIKQDAIDAANASGSTLQSIQNFYNSIYTEANKNHGTDELSASQMQKQKESIEQCYGVFKFEEPTMDTGCGVKARYVRILRSALDVRKPISFSQIVILDPNNNNIARGKQVSYNSLKPGANATKVVDGVQPLQARNSLLSVYIDNGDMNADREYYTVDLGSLTEIRSIQLVGTTLVDYPVSNIHNSIIQLIGSDGKTVITQKVLDTSFFQNAIGTLTFFKEELRDEVPVSTLEAGVQIDIYNLTHSKNVWNQPASKIGTITLEDGSIPGSFKLKRSDNFYMGCHYNKKQQEWVNFRPEGGEWYGDFYIIPAVNGSRGCVSIEIANTPGRYYAKVRDQWVEANFENIVSNSSDWMRACVSLLKLYKANTSITF